MWTICGEKNFFVKMLKYLKNIITSVGNDNHGHQHMLEREQSLLTSHIASVFKLIDLPHNCGINWDGNIQKILKKLLLHILKDLVLKWDVKTKILCSFDRCAIILGKMFKHKTRSCCTSVPRWLSLKSVQTL